jgi:glycosyltransferase involved in cell wall biosynthesis
MKVGLVTPEFSPLEGELGAFACELYRVLEYSGCDPVVLTTRPSSLPRVAYIRSMGPMSFSYKFALRSKGFIRETGVDVLHVLGGPEGVRLLASVSVPVIYTVPGLFHHHRSGMKNSWTSVLQRTVSGILERISYGHATRIVCPTSFVSNLINKQYTAHFDKIVVIPTGVDVSRYESSDQDRHVGRLLYVGNAKPYLGLEILLKALKIVVEANPNAHLVIVEGDTFSRYKIDHWLQQMELEDSVYVVGDISEEELAEEYGKAEIMVVPALAGGLGVRCLEAMACGLPVVGTRVHGVEEIVEDDSTGILVPPGDVNALADSIISLLRDSERRHELGERGRFNATRKYDSRTLVHEVIKLYTDVLHRP